MPEKKKRIRIQGRAVPIPAGYTITLDELRAVTGLSDKRHRQLADEGVYPMPINSCFKSPETWHGLVQYYKEMGQKKADSKALKDKKTEAEIVNLALEKERRELDIAQQKKQLISADEIKASVAAICAQIKDTISFKMMDQIPVLCEGKSASDIRDVCQEQFLEVCATMQAWAKKHGADKL